MKKQLDLTGQKFGELTAIAPTGRRGYNGEYWVCVCSCGMVKEIMAFDLRSGRVKSCGCGQHPQLPGDNRLSGSNLRHALGMGFRQFPHPGTETGIQD